MYFNDIEPIVDGNSEEYYFDEEAGLEVIRFIQGDIPSSEVFNEWLSKVPKVYKSNKEKVDYIEKQGVFLGFIRQAKGQWLDLPLVLELFQKAYLEALYGIKRKSKRFNKVHLIPLIVFCMILGAFVSFTEMPLFFLPCCRTLRINRNSPRASRTILLHILDSSLSTPS